MMKQIWTDQRGILLRGWPALIALAIFTIIFLVALINRDWATVEAVGPVVLLGFALTGINWIRYTIQERREARARREEEASLVPCRRCGELHGMTEGPYCRPCAAVVMLESMQSQGQQSSSWQDTPQPATLLQICPHCGARVTPGNYCSECGGRLP